jgi:transcriptional regulator with XRE-family HTH domain
MSGHAGERIRAARKRKGMTQKGLAEAVGCSQQTVVDIESQEAPRSRFLSAIVRTLGESLEWIESGTGGPSGGDYDAVHLPHYDLETAALRCLDPAAADCAIDTLYASPVQVSRLGFTVGVDTMTARLLPETARVDDVLFVDPLADPAPGRLVLAVMPGWDRAELRWLLSAGGTKALAVEVDDFGPRMVPCVPYRSRDDFLDHGNVTSDDAPSPALLVGVVVFIGREV